MFISASGWVGSTGFIGSVAELESQSEHPLFLASFAEDLRSDSLDFVIYTFKLQMWLFLIQVLLKSILERSCQEYHDVSCKEKSYGFRQAFR